jgi:hypothetical protein
MTAPFAALDVANLDAQLALFGQPATLLPINRAGPLDPDAPPTPSTTVAPIPVIAIRTEYHERVSVSDNGIGRISQGFRSTPSGHRRMATLRQPEGIVLRTGDGFAWQDRPGLIYRLTEVRADGMGGIILMLAETGAE